MQPIPRSPLSFGFQLQCFCHVLCDTRSLPAANLPFALMLKWTPSPVPFSHTHTQAYTAFYYKLLYSTTNAAPWLEQAFLLVNYYGRKENTCSPSVYGLFAIYLHLTYIRLPELETINQQTITAGSNVTVKSEVRGPHER